MKVNAIIRFTDTSEGVSAHSDLKLPISVNFSRDDINTLVDTSWFKMMIRRKMPGASTRRIRLIYNGRVLNDQTNYKTEVFEPKLKQMKDAGDDGPLEIYIHCLIGDELTPAQLEQERELDQKAHVSQTDPPVIGFDRLLSQGVSPQEVDDLRRQFQQIHFPGASDTGDVQGVTDMEENDRQQQRIRELEESWLDSTGYSAPNAGPSERPATNGGAQGLGGPIGEPEVSFSNESAIFGLLIGTFLGFLAVVFLMVDDTMFNRSHKMGIFAGIFANVVIATMKVWTSYGA